MLMMWWCWCCWIDGFGIDGNPSENHRVTNALQLGPSELRAPDMTAQLEVVCALDTSMPNHVSRQAQTICDLDLGDNFSSSTCIIEQHSPRHPTRLTRRLNTISAMGKRLTSSKCLNQVLLDAIPCAIQLRPGYHPTAWTLISSLQCLPLSTDEQNPMR